MTAVDVPAIPSISERIQMHGQLIPLGGGDAIPLRKTKLLIGRRPSCDIRLDFPNVSSQHCELEIVNGFWRVRDLRSSNGIKVNGERVDEKFLQPGDTLVIAKHRFEIDYTPDPNAVPIEEVDPFAIGLLEKAGLSRSDDNMRPPRPAPTPPKAVPPKTEKPEPKAPPGKMSDSDQAIQWLMEE